MKSTGHRFFSIVLSCMLIFEQSLSFVVKPKSLRDVQSLLSSSTHDELFDVSHTVSHVSSPHRRFIVTSPIIASLGIIVTNVSNNEASAADGTLDRIVGQLKEASRMLDDVPDLIKAEKWDSVRAILIRPPLSDLWTSGGSKQLLNLYADAIGKELPDGDEMTALELREEAISHLRYLDMAVYNNVFNPIATEGQSGATKELIRSYYEDPIMEWKASKAAVDALIGLASP
ncbi:hypothetical protein ACHAWX_007512 [Stephanocyclus meneghinianus]